MTGPGGEAGALAGSAGGTAAPGHGGRPALSIDRLTMTVPQMSEADAGRLAELVAEALRDWPTAPVASGRLARVETTVTAPTGGAAAPGDLATKIAEAILTAALRELI